METEWKTGDQKSQQKKPGIGGVEPGQRNIYVDLISVPFSKYFLAN